MKNVKDSKLPQFNSLEEEKEYWEARGPLAKGHRGIVNEPKPNQKRSSFLSVRLTGEELTYLRDAADKLGISPSMLARKAIQFAIENVGISSVEASSSRDPECVYRVKSIKVKNPENIGVDGVLCCDANAQHYYQVAADDVLEVVLDIDGCHLYSSPFITPFPVPENCIIWPASEDVKKSKLVESNK